MRKFVLLREWRLIKATSHSHTHAHLDKRFTRNGVGIIFSLCVCVKNKDKAQMWNFIFHCALYYVYVCVLTDVLLFHTIHINILLPILRGVYPKWIRSMYSHSGLVPFLSIYEWISYLKYQPSHLFIILLIIEDIFRDARCLLMLLLFLLLLLLVYAVVCVVCVV